MTPHGHAPSAVRCLVITVSDTRTAATDRSGPLAAELLQAAGHTVAGREIVPDEPERIREALLAAAGRADVEAVILTGGTGVSPRDRTPEAVRPLLALELPGFGELFRMLSWQEIGAAAMLSRALGGIGPGGKPVFALPGSSAAVRLGVERLIAPELAHLVGLARPATRYAPGQPTA